MIITLAMVSRILPSGRYCEIRTRVDVHEWIHKETEKPPTQHRIITSNTLYPAFDKPSA